MPDFSNDYFIICLCITAHRNNFAEDDQENIFHNVLLSLRDEELLKVLCSKPNIFQFAFNSALFLQMVQA